MSADDFENLTDVELAAQLYLAILAPDDEVSDHVAELYLPASKMASALWARLRGPYCEAEGCGGLHTEAFPWCARHLQQWYDAGRPREWKPDP